MALGFFKWYKADKKYEEIHALFLHDDYEQAEKDAVELLKKKPDHIKTLLLVAQMAWNQDHYQKSWERYNKVVHYSPLHKDWLLWRAQSSYQMYNFEHALDDYLTLYEISFKNTEYLIKLADIYQKINLQLISLRFYKKAVKQSPKSINAHLWAWYQHIILWQYWKANKHIIQAKEVYYEDKKAHEKATLENIEWMEEHLNQLMLEPKKKTKKKVTRKKTTKGK